MFIKVLQGSDKGQGIYIVITFTGVYFVISFNTISTNNSSIKIEYFLCILQVMGSKALHGAFDNHDLGLYDILSFDGSFHILPEDL